MATRHLHRRSSSDVPGRIGVVILAAGRGERFGHGPKSALELAGKSLLEHVVASMGASRRVAEMVVTAPETFFEETAELLRAAQPSVPTRVIEGGSTRQASAHAGVAAVSADVEWVAVTDVARPLVPDATLDSLMAAVLDASSASDWQPCGAVPVVPIIDSVHLIAADRCALIAPFERDRLCAAQTPQFFHRECLVEAHEAAARDGAECTDDVGAVARLGGRVLAVPGDSANIKITYARDLEVAAALHAQALGASS
jgi:2-C-methyl-D-erythritol 4-phosphate cytidylyltransferase